VDRATAEWLVTRPEGSEASKVRCETFEFQRYDARWSVGVGESRLWAPLGKPLISIAGGFPVQHAPEDLPRLATTPELLESSYRATLAAARLLTET
jgi:hypothetical protein